MKRIMLEIGLLLFLTSATGYAEDVIHYPGKDFKSAASAKNIEISENGITVKKVNYITNSSMEEGAKRPKGWPRYQFHGKVSTGFSWDDSESYQGKKSIMIKLDGSGKWEGTYCKCIVKNVKEKMFTASIYVKTIAVSRTSEKGHYLYISVYYKDGTCTDPIKTIRFPREDNDWKRVSGSFELDLQKEVKVIHLCAISCEIAGVFWVDCMQLEPGDKLSPYSDIPYPKISQYISPPLFLKDCTKLNIIEWRADIPEGTRIFLSTRTANSELELFSMGIDENWSEPLYRDSEGEKIISSSKKFIQYKVIFVTPDNSTGPAVLKEVQISYN